MTLALGFADFSAKKYNSPDDGLEYTINVVSLI